jgi:chromosome partitioning protein
MRSIAVMNQKGGCGKTTIAINLCGALTQLDRRVLLIDMDPQAHATIGLGVDSEGRQTTTYELLRDPMVTPGDAMVKIADRLFLVPANTVLAAVEQQLAEEMGREHKLAEKLARVDPDAFDFVVVDCPPSVGLLTFNALVGTDEVVIPVDASFFSLHGLSKLRETIDVIEDELNHPLQVHVVCNNLDTRTHFSNELLEEIERFHAAVLVDAYISHSVRLKEAAAKGVTIFELARTSKPAQQFLSLSRELAERAPRVEAQKLDEWRELLSGPRRVTDGVQFTLNAPAAAEVIVTGEFTNWSRRGVKLVRDSRDGLWKATVEIDPGEYEYRFIVDGVWIRDPRNQDYIRNEFGQENSLLVI